MSAADADWQDQHSRGRAPADESLVGKVGIQPSQPWPRRVDVLAVMLDLEEGAAKIKNFALATRANEARAAVAELIEAASNIQCDCSLRERDSGHRIGCDMPYLRAALARIGAP